jgi:hypothetical protein
VDQITYDGSYCSAFLLRRERLSRLVVSQSASTRSRATSSSLIYGLDELDRRGISFRTGEAVGQWRAY